MLCCHTKIVDTSFDVAGKKNAESFGIDVASRVNQ